MRHGGGARRVQRRQRQGSASTTEASTTTTAASTTTHRGDDDDGGHDHHASPRRRRCRRPSTRSPASRRPTRWRRCGRPSWSRSTTTRTRGPRPASTRPTSSTRRSSRAITRFFTIFQSTDAGPVGPIRSARSTDVDLLDQLNRPLFVWSGGNRNVVREIGGANADQHGLRPGPRLLPRPSGPERRHRAHAVQRGHGRPSTARSSAGRDRARAVLQLPAGRDAVDRRPARDGHRRRDEQRAGPLGVGRRRRACGSAASTARPTSTRPACPSTRPTSSCSSCPTGPARPTPARPRPSRSARATRGSSRTAS